MDTMKHLDDLLDCLHKKIEASKPGGLLIQAEKDLAVTYLEAIRLKSEIEELEEARKERKENPMMGGMMGQPGGPQGGGGPQQGGGPNPSGGGSQNSNGE